MRQAGVALVMLMLVPPLVARQGPIGGVTTTEAQLILAVDRMLYDRWYPPESIPLPPAHPDDRGLFAAALNSSDTTIRSLAIRLAGRLENPADASQLAQSLTDRSPIIRAAAALSVAQLLARVGPPYTDDLVGLFEARLAQESNGSALEALFDLVGQLRYGDTAALKIQLRLASLVTLTAEKIPADRRSVRALSAIEMLFRQSPFQPLDPDVRQLVLTVAKPDPPAMPYEDALRILVATGQGTREVAVYAARFSCVRVPTRIESLVPRCDETGGVRTRSWGLRLMNPRDPESRPFFEEAARDRRYPDLQHQALQALAGLTNGAIPCDSELAVIQRDLAGSTSRIPATLRAIDLIGPRCENLGALVEELKKLSRRLGDPASHRVWQVPARSLVKLMELNAEAAVPLISGAAIHIAWQVRVAAADASQLAGDEATLLRLAADDNLNVRSEAISALSRLRSPAVFGPAIDAVGSRDNQLILVGAVALAAANAPSEREPAMESFTRTLRRLTTEARDSSRPVRLEILQRLKEFARVQPVAGAPILLPVSDLRSLLTDFDPFVAAAAADVLGEISGVRPIPKPTYRPPEQPSEAELEDVTRLDSAFLFLPMLGPVRSADVVIELDTGERHFLALNKRDAPLAIARFFRLAREGYYNGQTFYAASGSPVFHWGSPAANDYMGTNGFWRDEISSERTPSAGGVALLTHGRDTGDGRFFIADTELERFSYTILGRVVSERQPAIEGTKIVRVLVPPSRR